MIRISESGGGGGDFKGATFFATAREGSGPCPTQYLNKHCRIDVDALRRVEDQGHPGDRSCLQDSRGKAAVLRSCSLQLLLRLPTRVLAAAFDQGTVSSMLLLSIAG